MLKINTSTFYSFLKKITLNGKIDECVLNFTPTGLRAMNADRPKTTVVLGELKAESFVEYESIGKVGVRDTTLLLKILKGFKEDIEIEVVENRLKMKDSSRKIECTLIEPDFISTKIDKTPNLTYDGGAVMSVDIWKRAFENVATLNQSELHVEIKNKSIVFTAGDSRFGKIVERQPIDYKNVKVSFGTVLKDVINVCDSEITVKINDNYPITIEEYWSGGSCKYIVAPIVED